MTGKIFKERYRIIELIGSGGMADVYRAQDERLGRNVALKILKPELASNREFLHRFYREASSAAKLSHPNIINVFDIEEDDGTQFIIMEYLDAQNLKSYLKKLKKPLTESALVTIVKSILKALSFAHSKGIIHRDLKPHNVLITKDNTIKVTDFGIARALFSDTITQTGSLIGSVHYFSPEQAQGKPTTAPADIYSLGVLMFEMLTEKLPFEGDNPVAVALKHVQEQPPAPSSLNPSISPDLERIILKAMAKDPLARYQNCDEMLQDIDRLEPGGPKGPRGSSKGAETSLIMPPSKPTKTREEIEEVSRHLKNRREDREMEEVQGKREPSLLKGFAFALLVLILLVAIVLLILYGSRQLQETETPDLIGKSITGAQAIVAEKGLNLTIQSEIFSNDKAEGTILEQKPPPGEKIKPGKTIYVTISKGKKTIEVPDLTGVTLVRSRQILLDRGLTNVKVKDEFNDKVPEGVVISQQPAAENMVSPSSLISLVVSKGPAREKIPDLTGKTKDDAQKILSQIQVKLVIDGMEPSAQFPLNCIIRQTPAPGTLLVKDSTVKVVLSKGMEGLTSPNLIGKSITEAQQILEPLGISLKVEGEEKGQNALIITQEPPAGEAIKDKLITVTAESTALVPELIGKKAAEARELIVKKGFLVGNVTFREASEAPPDTVLEQEPPAGIEAQQGIKISIVLSKASTAPPHGTPPITTTPEPSPEPSAQPSPAVK
jgi:eukaryotic-like serine/threonine-protein kinase